MEFLDIKEIGSGGMGKIYTAFSSDLNRRVILKTLHPALSSYPRFKARFKKEAEILALLSHPNIVPFIGYETIRIDTQQAEVSEREKKKMSAAKPLPKQARRVGAHVGTGKCQQDCARVRDSEHPGSTQAP
jgi:serine/threonine protein kinase